MDDEEDSDEEPDFFHDIEFVTVAMVFVFLHF